MYRCDLYTDNYGVFHGNYFFLPEKKKRKKPGHVHAFFQEMLDSLPSCFPENQSWKIYFKLH